MKQIGLDCGRLSQFEKVQVSQSLNELLEMFSIADIPSSTAERGVENDAVVSHTHNDHKTPRFRSNSDCASCEHVSKSRKLA